MHHSRRAPFVLGAAALILVGASVLCGGSSAEESNDEPPLPPPPIEWKALKLTLEGYLRVRGDVWNDLDLSRGPTPTTGQPIFPTAAAGGTGDVHTLSSLDMRLRLEPTLEIGQAVRIHMRADILDNVGFGSTPDVLPSYSSAYATAYAASPVGGINSVGDAIKVKQAWGEVLLPFGTLSAGRMGALVNWGTGFFVNNGSCISCDLGDSGDRISLTLPILGHYLTALYELSASGPQVTPVAQPIDVERRAHVDTFALGFARYDSPEAQRRRLKSERTLVQYGLLGSYRGQELDAPSWTQPGGLTRGSFGPNDFVRRDVKSAAGDLWVLVHHKGFRAELEAAIVWARVGDASATPGVAFTQPLTSLQYGGVASVSYQFKAPIRLRLESGFASGDDAPGFGVRTAPGQLTTQKGDLDGPQFHPPSDWSVDNFRFHPDYHIDLILFRRIIGLVTDAAYLRPSIGFGPFGGKVSGLGAEIAVIASRAIYASTPPGQDPNLGIEIDARVRYRIEPGFEINLAYGVLVPGAGFKNLPLHLDPKPAQALEAILAYRM